MISELPVLVVVIPLLSAPACVLIRRRGGVRLLAAISSLTSFGIAVTLLRQTLAGGPISYHLGGWPPPLGIEYRVTVTSAFVLVVVSSIAAVVMMFDSRAVPSRLPLGRRYLYYAAFLLCVSGLLGMVVTGDAFNTFVFLEISSLASYSLISMGRERRALMASYSYLIMGTIGGTFVLLGIGMLYQMTGTLNFADLAARLPPVLSTRTVEMGAAFLVVGLSIKLAVFPLHQWLPNAYTYAPAKVSAFLAGTATKVSYFVLIRIIFTVFGVAFVFDTVRLHHLLLPLSALAMFIGSTSAIFQTDLRRLLAYSSIAQVGYMTLGLSLHTPDGVAGGIVHLLNHGLTKSGLFLVVACIAARVGSSEVKDLAGLGQRMPWTSAALVVGGLSLIGVPGTAGFVSKWLLVAGALQRQWMFVAVLILTSSLLAVVYVWRLVELSYFSKPPEGAPAGDPGWTLMVPTWILIGATVVFGFWTSPTAGVAKRAAAELLSALP